VPAHVPFVQTSLVVQGLPSLQGVLLALFGLEQLPVVELQTPASWHWSSGVQVFAGPAVQVPA
jgi:hypothetical protein